MIKYNTGFCFSLKLLFEKFDIDKISLTNSELLKIDKNLNKRKLAQKVFFHCLYLVVMDIIKNNTIFRLPTKREAVIQMAHISGDNFIKYRKKGGAQEIDFLESNFTMHHLELYYNKGYINKRKRIYVSKNFKDIITENTNNGRKY